MYRCEQCSAIVPTNTPALTLVTEKRPRIYPFRENANRKIDRRGFDTHHRHDHGGHGWEIAHEIKVCAPCHQAGRRADPIPAPPDQHAAPERQAA